jgi:hypothetical protein
MGYKYARQKVLQALNLRAYSHEVRHAIDVKNLLHSGDVTPEEVISLIESSISMPWIWLATGLIHP